MPPREMTLGALVDSVTGDAHKEVACAASNWRDISVSGLSLDTRAIQAGDVYLALPGRASHGMDHASSAVACGAVAIITVPEATKLNPGLSVPVVEVAALESRVNDLADTFFGSPADALRLVAVTGTDGKTSVCRFIADAFAAIGDVAGYIGTLGWGVVGDDHALDATALTTPDAVALRRILRALLDQGATVVALEASSHGIAEGRLEGLSIDVAVLTNIGHDHLDYHKTFAAYRATKARLFDWPSLIGMVVNIDDSLGARLASRYARESQRVATFSLSEGQAAARVAEGGVYSHVIVATDIRSSAAGLTFNLREERHDAEVCSGLIGQFNVENLLACHGVMRLLGCSFGSAASALSGLPPVPGRMERVSSHISSSIDAGSHISTQGEPAVIVDYAHTADALVAALSAARAHCEGALIVVFGCGGDRDPGKREHMAIAAEVADQIIVTDDNPRTEDAAVIRGMVMKGFSDQSRVSVVPDRRAAIEQAIAQAQIEDTVLIAGKGHEDYQIIGETRYPFDDCEVARAALSARAGCVAPATDGTAPRGERA